MKNPFTVGLSLVRYFPHIWVYLTCDAKSTIDYEIEHWNQVYDLPARRGVRGLIYLLKGYREFRSLFYFRTGIKWLATLAKGQNNLEFYTSSDKIGKGLVIWHGFSTVINAKEMGENCQVWQNVTIGKKTSTSQDDRPTIGIGAKICAGAIVVGDIELAKDVVVGAGAVVVNDVPVDGTVVVSQRPRYIVKS